MSSVRRSPDRLTTFLNPTVPNALRTPHSGSAVAAKPVSNQHAATPVFHTPERISQIIFALRFAMFD
jgi:hypothetical protein